MPVSTFGSRKSKPKPSLTRNATGDSTLTCTPSSHKQVVWYSVTDDSSPRVSRCRVRYRRIAAASSPLQGLSHASTVTADPENAPPTMRSSICSSGCGSRKIGRYVPNAPDRGSLHGPSAYCSSQNRYRIELVEQMVASLETTQRRSDHSSSERMARNAPQGERNDHRSAPASAAYPIHCHMDSC